MKRREVLCVYGFPEEEVQERFASWLHEEKSRDVVLLQENTALKELAWQLLLTELRLALPEHLQEQDKKKAKTLFEQLQFWQLGAEALLSDVRDLGKRVVGNILLNLPLLQGSLRASSFKDVFTGIPAIICGAGPSLDQHRCHMEQAKQSALMFAGGSSVKCLWTQGIQPHFAAAVDPDSPRELFATKAAETIPYIFPLRVAPWLLSEVKLKKIWAADGISYPLETWLTEQLGLQEPPIEGGWNVATFCISLAVHMGCNPVILVGVDLSLPEGKSYAEGIGHTYVKERLIDTEQGVTKGDFILAADWIEEFKEKHPHITLYNVSAEAWKISGVEHKTFSEVLSLLPQLNLQKKVDTLLAEAPPTEFFVSVKEVITCWIKSLDNVKHSCEEMLAFFEKDFPCDPRIQGEYILKEVELEEEPVYRFLLQPVWEVWRPLFQQSQVQEPFTGFHETVQKLLFWKQLAEEVYDAEI